MPVTVASVSPEAATRNGVNYKKEHLTDSLLSNSHDSSSCYHSDSAGTVSNPAFANLALSEEVTVKQVKVLMRDPIKGDPGKKGGCT